MFKYGTYFGRYDYFCPPLGSKPQTFRQLTAAQKAEAILVENERIQ
jgi:hypothetical protein